jgi:hypothetical protein
MAKFTRKSLGLFIIICIGIFILGKDCLIFICLIPFFGFKRVRDIDFFSDIIAFSDLFIEILKKWDGSRE